MSPRLLLCAALLVACGDDAPRLRPFIVTPPDGDPGYPYADIDAIQLSVAHAGDDTDVVAASFPLTGDLSLAGAPFGDDLVVHMSGRAGTVEIAYGRTCALSVQPSGVPDAPRLYFSRIVQWAAGPTPEAAARVAGVGYSRPDGSAVFVGGGPAIDAVERFDPVTGAFETLEATSAVRTGVVLAPFGDGRALLVGGANAAGNAVPFLEVLDPRPGLRPERQVVQLVGPRLMGHAAVTLADGSVLVTGGAFQTEDAAPFVTTDTAWSFRFGVAGQLEAPDQLPVFMTTPRRDHTMTRLVDETGADVLIVGGRDAAGAPVGPAELYRPLRGAFEPVAGASLLVPRWGHAAVRMPGGSVLIVGGVRPDPGGGAPVPVPELEVYDPFQGQFSPAGTLPADAGHTELSVTPLPDGRVLFAGGRDAAGNPTAQAQIARLDPVDGQVDLSVTAPLGRPRAGHTALPLCDGTILVVGGTAEPAPSERYNPPSAGRR